MDINNTWVPLPYMNEERDYTPRYAVYMWAAGRGYTPAGWEIKHRYGAMKGQIAAGKPTNENLAKYIKDYEDSTEAGGVNDHIGKSRGGRDVIDRAEIKDQQTGDIVATYRREEAAMKFLQEVVEHVKPVITEEAGQGKMYFIEGPFLQANIKNRNGRIYPVRTLAEEVRRYNRELVNEQRALGELGHPDSPQINLPLVSHIITELTQDGMNFSGKAKILDTPNGKIVKALIDENIKLGVSSRGVGSLTSTPNGNVVGEDFYLATAADIVADPSAPNAFVRGIMEGRDWVWDNGILTEAQVAAIQREVAAAPRKKAVARQLTEAAAFEKFLRSIRVTMRLP